MPRDALPLHVAFPPALADAGTGMLKK